MVFSNHIPSLSISGVSCIFSVLSRGWSGRCCVLIILAKLISGSGLFSNVLHDTTVRCNQVEVNIFQPPQGKTCGQFAGPFLSMGSGALYNPQDTANCQYCRYSTGDEYLKTLNINWKDRWRNFGFMWAYVCFNLGMIVLATYIPRGIRQIKKKRQGKLK